jgi:hypothetical protein
MPNNYTENAALWKQLSDIDYFTMFVKAWIPFNAWMRNAFDFKSDREIINHMKSSSNRFKDRIKNLIESNSADGETLKSYIQNLHLQLQITPLNLDGQNRISFEKIVVEKNTNLCNTFDFDGITYNVGFVASNSLVSTAIEKRTSRSLFRLTQSKYNIDDLRSQVTFLSLTAKRQGSLIQCYEEVNPYKPLNLLTSNLRDSIQCGSLHFVNDSDVITKGIIEILYLLRNGLFHGEIVPDKQTSKIYEQAYHILKIGIEQI